eukprot:1183525-Prorocentrum_minimum.AAC.2
MGLTNRTLACCVLLRCAVWFCCAELCYGYALLCYNCVLCDAVLRFAALCYAKPSLRPHLLAQPVLHLAARHHQRLLLTRPERLAYGGHHLEEVVAAAERAQHREKEENVRQHRAHGRVHAPQLERARRELVHVPRHRLLRVTNALDKQAASTNVVTVASLHSHETCTVLARRRAFRSRFCALLPVLRSLSPPSGASPTPSPPAAAISAVLRAAIVAQMASSSRGSTFRGGGGKGSSASPAPSLVPNTGFPWSTPYTGFLTGMLGCFSGARGPQSLRPSPLGLSLASSRFASVALARSVAGVHHHFRCPRPPAPQRPYRVVLVTLAALGPVGALGSGSGDRERAALGPVEGGERLDVAARVLALQGVPQQPPRRVPRRSLQNEH